MTVHDEVFEQGLALRREMFGAAGSDRALETASENSLPLQEMVTRFCFGEVWQRPGQWRLRGGAARAHPAQPALLRNPFRGGGYGCPGGRVGEVRAAALRCRT